MPEDIVLKHSDPSVLPWVVPVPDGSTPEAVAALYADAGWSLSEQTPADLQPAPVEAVLPTPSPADVPAPVAEVPAPTAAVDAAPVVPAEPATPDAAPADVAITEGN